jgi:hypothetical protein
LLICFGSAILIHRLAKLAALYSAYGLLLLDAALFALADEPTLASDSTQNTTLNNLFAKALEQ